IQRLFFRYTNPDLNIGLNNWREVYLLEPAPLQLFPEVYRGKLMYRAKGSHNRIPYNKIKDGLLRRAAYLETDVPDWL
ncbi:MAG TPA: hypothetical protein VM187_12180, partial [Niastella sp.]|nr:hypothetical protein [Niastella sp.]